MSTSAGMGTGGAGGLTDRLGHHFGLPSGVGGRTGPPSRLFGVSLDSVDAFVAPPWTFTKVPYTNELYDDRGDFDVANHRFVASSPSANGYRICASLASFSQDFELDLFINDVRENAIAVAGSGIAAGCRTLRLAPNSTVDVRLHHWAAGNLAFAPNPWWSWLTIYELPSTLASLDDTLAFTATSGGFTQVPYVAPIYNDTGAGGGPAFDVVTHQTVDCFSFRCDWSLCASAASFTNQVFELDVFVNGARERAFAMSRYGIATGCRSVRTQRYDRVDVWLYQASGTPMSVAPNTYWNWLTLENNAIEASMGNVATFTVPDRTFTTVPYGSELIDDYSSYDPQTGRFTAPATRDYRFCASLASFGGEFELDLFVNGGRENAFAASTQGFAEGCRTIRLNALDYVEVRVHQQTGTAMTFQPNVYWNWLTITLGN